MARADAMKWGRMLVLAAAVTLLGGQHEQRGAGARATAAQPQEGPVRICRWYGPLESEGLCPSGALSPHCSRSARPNVTLRHGAEANLSG
jgi:hypothetical protein